MKKRLLAMVLALVMTGASTICCFADTADKTNEELLAQYYAALEKQGKKAEETIKDAADTANSDALAQYYAALEKQQKKAEDKKETTKKKAKDTVASMKNYKDLKDYMLSLGYAPLYFEENGKRVDMDINYKLFTALSANGKYLISFGAYDKYADDPYYGRFLNVLGVTDPTESVTYYEQFNVTVDGVKKVLDMFK